MRNYIIAEVGPNHNGNAKTAISMIEQLADIGVDAVKFQLANPDNFFSLDSFKPKYQRESVKKLTPIQMSRKFKLSNEEHIALYKKCRENNVDYLCSAFDIDSLKFIDNKFDLRFFKVASGEIFSLDLIDYISKRKKPIILSTGMALFEDIQISINLLNKHFLKEITILHCVSKYPTPYVDVNLNIISDLQKKFNYPVGFSDHTVGIECALASVALGSSIIEKHVTLDKNQSGPDHKASADIDEFKQLVKSVRNLEKALEKSEKKFTKEEIEIRNSARKSIVSKRTINIGDIITEDDICFKRPGYGFSPLEIHFVVGRRASKIIKINRIINKEDLE